MFKLALSTLALLATHANALGTDYLDAAPATVYEAEMMSPQNMDFDMENNMFVAHSGWYNDQLIHYYKFRIFAPGTYPDVIAPGGTAAQVPLQKIYMMTTTGGFDGVVGMPIVEYHTADGVVYSDFMEVVFVTAAADYVADTYKSVADITESGAAMTDSGIVLNIPVVPTGSTLQDPAQKGTAAAAIAPTMTWYRGQEVQTYVFEVTDASAATFFADTRESTTSPARQELTTGLEVPVVSFASATAVSAIPLWHVNQYSFGVVEGEGGGPDPMGMKNVINLDRPDAGYSPLWNIWWGTDMPVNFMADDFSNAAQATADSGLTFFQTPMYVNCPDIGLVGETNTLKAETFQTSVMTGLEKNKIQGSHQSLIFQADVPLTLVAKPSGDVVAETTTTVMGSYAFKLLPGDLPEGTVEVVVMNGEEALQSESVMEGGEEEEGGDSAAASYSMVAAAAAVASAVAMIVV